MCSSFQLSSPPGCEDNRLFLTRLSLLTSTVGSVSTFWRLNAFCSATSVKFPILTNQTTQNKLSSLRHVTLHELRGVSSMLHGQNQRCNTALQGCGLPAYATSFLYPGLIRRMRCCRCRFPFISRRRTCILLMPNWSRRSTVSSHKLRGVGGMGSVPPLISPPVWLDYDSRCVFSLPQMQP